MAAGRPARQGLAGYFRRKRRRLEPGAPRIDPDGLLQFRSMPWGHVAALAVVALVAAALGAAVAARFLRLGRSAAPAAAAEAPAPALPGPAVPCL